MIKRIFNWSFGAFFKTIGRILAYLSVGFLLAIVCSKFGFNFGYIQVNAANAYDWASSLPSLSRVEMRDCTASNTCTTNVSLTNDGLTTSNYERIMFTTSSQYTIASNGLAFATYYNSLKKGYLYTANFYICSSADITDATPTMYTSVYDSMGVNNMTYTSSVSVNLSNQPGNGSQSFGRCRQYTGLFVPKKDNDPWIILRLKSSKAIKSYFQIIATEVSELGIYTDTIKEIVENSNSNVVDAVDKVTEETKKTSDAITSTSDNDEDESCGIICKLKTIVKFLKPTSLSNLIIPNEEQMHDLMDTMQTQVTSKLGILGFPITLYTQMIDLVQNVSDTNWCIDWPDVTVPNFEDSVIIASGQFCFSSILQNEKINAFRVSCHLIIGALILLAFVQFLKNCYNRVLDLPDREEYTYFTTEDVYSVSANGETELKQVRNRSTYREKR